MNAFKELERHFQKIGKHNADIEWFRLNDVRNYGEDNIIIDNVGPMSPSDLDELKSFDYDDGFGGQVLDGIIVFNDGSWLERGEYDGSEWWEFKQTPKYKAVDTIHSIGSLKPL